MSIVGQSYVGHVLLDMFLKFGATGPIGGEDDPPLKGDNDLGFGGGMQLGQVQSLQLLLVHHYDVHTLLELVDNTRLQVLVEGNQSLTSTAPGRMHVDYQQFGIFVGVVREEVLGVADNGCQLHLLSLRCHYLSYIITLENRDSNYHSQNRDSNINPTITQRFIIRLDQIRQNHGRSASVLKFEKPCGQKKRSSICSLFAPFQRERAFWLEFAPPSSSSASQVSDQPPGPSWQ